MPRCRRRRRRRHRLHSKQLRQRHDPEVLRQVRQGSPQCLLQHPWPVMDDDDPAFPGTRFEIGNVVPRRAAAAVVRIYVAQRHSVAFLLRNIQHHLPVKPPTRTEPGDLHRRNRSQGRVAFVKALPELRFAQQDRLLINGRMIAELASVVHSLLQCFTDRVGPRVVVDLIAHDEQRGPGAMFLQDGKALGEIADPPPPATAAGGAAGYVING
mmetsp:Transcript_17991/g.68192  ORF Transcript_17991/g.68192 Transcript_17991/m.68192 type:complete len:212 (+) Transcript_17991:2075-2710(+)